MFRLLVLFTKGNPTLARRLVLVSALREGKKIMQVGTVGAQKNAALWFSAPFRGFIETFLCEALRKGEPTTRKFEEDVPFVRLGRVSSSYCAL